MHLRNRHENRESFICKCGNRRLATEGRISRRKTSRSICHGLTRNFTETKHFFQSRMRERRLLPCAGVYNFLLHIFTSLKRKRRFFLAEANTTFIAYLYKPEAQAKVFKMRVYYPHIIPSLALQACKIRDTVKSPFPHPPLIVDKGARPLRQAQGPGLLRYGQ